jgi:glycosyltransferase involved in cell wall biosynthesis
VNAPLLALTMIVKDEERGLGKTLASVKPFIDRWLVVDTGSTDRTRDIVKAELDGVPGELVEEPFIDFSTTRNVALDRLGERAAFVMWLDADDHLEGGAALRRFCEAHRNKAGPEHDAFYVRVLLGSVFDSVRVVRAAAGYRFKGAVHEVLTHSERPLPTFRVPDVAIRHTRPPVSEERSRRRWERDAGLLGRALETDPNDTRSAFYLAQTFLWLGKLEEAARAFDRRIAMGGWQEEIYQSKMALAGIGQASGAPWATVLELYLEAHATAPHRAEPLHRIALHYDGTGQHALCFLFARRGYELPFPAGDRLFVDEEVYRWKLADLVGSSAYWLGAFELGEEAARKAVRACPNDARLARNLGFYDTRKAQAKARRRR